MNAEEKKIDTNIIGYNLTKIYDFKNSNEKILNNNIAKAETNRQLKEKQEIRVVTKQEERKKKKMKIALFITTFILLMVFIIFLSIYFTINPKKNIKDKSTDNLDEKETLEETKTDTSEEGKINNNEESKEDPIIIEGPKSITKEEAMKAFISNFNITSKKDSLTQLSLKSKQTYNTTSSGNQSSYSIISNAKYDIYTLNSTSSNEDKAFYNTKYTTVVTINSLCTKLSTNSSDNDCDLKKYLDLNIKNSNKIRVIDESSIEKMKEVILPICLIEHTDSNIILSVTCPNTLSSNLKKDIILAFETIKPDSASSITLNENDAGTKTEEKDGKIYINSFDNNCKDYDGDPNKKMTCNLTRYIITDKEGNLIKSERISKTETVLDKNNKYSNTLIYNFEDISKQNMEEFNPENYKSNLDTVFILTKNLMEKDNYISDGEFEEILGYIMKGGDNSSEIYIRDLQEEDTSNSIGAIEENVFKKTIYNINMSLNFGNDIGLGENAKAITNFQTGNQSQELSYNGVYTYLEETLNKFITLSKSGNKLASELLEKINDPLVELRDIINEDINELNELLAFKELSAIFDSTYAINGLDKLPSKFIAAAENLYKGLDNLNTDAPYIIDNMRKQLKEDISKFLLESHELLYNIFKNLTEATNSLSSQKNKIAEISSYYLNDTDTSYVDIIKEAKEILDNYYINEKNLIQPLVEKMLNDFPKKTLIESLKNVQNSLDQISERIDKGNLLITFASNDDYKNVIKNIYNANNKVNEIIKNVQSKFENSLNIKSNGYFENQYELDNNNHLYGKISERAMNISYILDNNELIDKTFDNIMIFFREQFMVLLDYMDRSKREQFPLKEDVLSTSFFPLIYINQIEQDFKNEKAKIINFIKEENKEYLDLINENITLIKTSSGNNLEEIISNIQIELSDLNLDNLEKEYHEIFNYTLDNISSIIETNYYYSNIYLTNVVNSKSTHRTNKFQTSYNIYINSFSEIKNYIKNILKNDLVSKYKTIITQIRTSLQTIKSNEIIKKYSKHLSFVENQLRIIDNLYERLDKYISDSLFNEKYLSTINNFINSKYSYLTEIEHNLTTLYNSQTSLTYSSDTNYDYFRKELYSYSCCTYEKRDRCYRYGTCAAYHYVGYKVVGSNNHELLKQINFNQYTSKFDETYNTLYKQFNNYIISYNNVLSELNEPLEIIKNNIIIKNKENNYLNTLSENITNIIEEKLGDNLLNSTYNYYKNELIQKLPTELNSILEKWKNTFDEVYNYLNTNISNFKTSISEFSLFSAFYSTIYSQNISYGYFDSVINKVKNDFNYTIQYYYNLIVSKVNKTYSYILNNIPTNEKPFDEIINLRIQEINKSHNDLLSKIISSKNSILKGQYQLNNFKVSDNNFFSVNNIITDNVQTINQELAPKIAQFSLLSNTNLKQDSPELIVAKLYLENAQNGKQIKENYDQINKATFIDLQNEVYKNLIDEVWDIEQDELIKNIKISLIESNENLLNNFKYEKEKYIDILQNKIYSEYYTKENLAKEIKAIYSNGLKTIDENSKIIILGYINEVLTNIKTHLTNEANRLSNTLTSYSNDYNNIKNRLDNYKTSIYEQFYNIIFSVVNDFYSNVTKKFYSDYIEHYLDEYKKSANEEKFTSYSFLNISLNLTEIINQNIEIVINEYKELTKNQINYLNKKKIQEINKLFNFSEIENNIKNEIDRFYTEILEPVLKKFAIYNSGDDQIIDYDLPNNILNDINELIEQKINQSKIEINKMEGNNYLKLNYNIPGDFSLVKLNEFLNIKNSFKNFTSAFSNQELKNFKNIVLENIKNNFKLIINNFVPSFGKDFFDRILKYNEIQKIKSLYNNLKYSIIESLVYYIAICRIQLKTSSTLELPVDIKLKILTLNNLDETVISKNNQVISTLNSKLEQFFEETKNYIVEKYIKEMKTDVNIEINFEEKIKTIIKQSLDGNRDIFENEYLSMMNNIIKTSFIEQYTKAINKETNDMYYFVNKAKEEGRDSLNNFFTLKTDEILSDIETKLNNTIKAIKLYKYHFNNTFKVQNEIQQFLDDFGKDIILPKFQEIKDLLDKETKELIRNNLIKYSKEYEKEYSIETFENKTKEINLNLTNYFDDLNNTLKKYGSSDEEYKLNLEKEVSNYKRIRRLEDTNEEKILYNQQASYNELDKTMNIIKNSALDINKFIESFNLFNNFEEKINKYIIDLNYQNGISENLIKKNDDNYEELSIKLYELHSLSLDYYDKANSTYNELKEFIKNRIKLINELIEKCSNITYKVLSNKYIDIKNDFNPVKKIMKEEEETVAVDKFNLKAGTDLSYTIETRVEKFLVDNEFILDIIFDEESKNPKIIGKVINKNKPKKFEINFYSQNGQSCGKIGRKISTDFNNITLLSDIDYTSGLSYATINTNFNNDEYNVKTRYYESVEHNEVISLMGIQFPIHNLCKEEERDTPENENDFEIIPLKIKKGNKTYSY